MNMVKLIPQLLAALMLVLLTGCASTDLGARVSQYLDDASITAGVKAALLNQPNLSVSDVNVETYKGIVQLSGFVASPDTAAAAAKAARQVRGVKSVKNDIRLK